MLLMRRNYLPAILAVAGLGAALLVPAGLAASAASVSGPTLTLEAAQRSVTLDRFGGVLYPDAGIWLTAHGSPLQFDLRRDGKLLWCDRIVLEGGARALQSGAILDGASAFGTMVATPCDASDALLAACRRVCCDRGSGAVTRLPHALVARFLGDSAAAARTYFATLWGLLRPALAGREAVFPRIWST